MVLGHAGSIAWSADGKATADPGRPVGSGVDRRRAVEGVDPVRDCREIGIAESTGDLDDQLTRDIGDRHVHLRGSGHAGTFDGLEDAEVHRFLDMPFVTPDPGSRHAQPRRRRPFRSPQGHLESFGFEQRWVDPVGDRPQCIDRLLRLLGKTGHQRCDLLRSLALGEGLGDAELDLQGHDLLLCPVVQIAFESVPLRVLGGDQAQTRLTDIAGALFELPIEAHVAQHQAGAGRDIREQFPVGRRRRIVASLRDAQVTQHVVTMSNRRHHRAVVDQTFWTNRLGGEHTIGRPRSPTVPSDRHL